MLEIFQGISALISAIGTLLAGIATIMTSFPKIKNWFRKKFSQKKYIHHLSTKECKMNKVNYTSLIIGTIFILYSLFVFAFQSFSAQDIPLNQKLTKMAWDYYNNHNFEKAIEKANECIKLFRVQAELKQEELMKKSTYQPNPTPDSKEKKEIFSRGLLNDVATCYYIKGANYEELKKNEEAVRSYSKAEYFTYAMCWDPQGWFWNISEAASGKLRELRNP